MLFVNICFLGTQKSCTRRAWEGIPTGLVYSSFANISCFYFLFYEQRLSSSSLVIIITNIIIIKINIIIFIMVILNSLILVIFIISISIILKNLHLRHHLIIIIITITITGQHHQDHYCTMSLPITKIVQNVFSFLIGFNAMAEMFYITSQHWPNLKDVCHYSAVATNRKIFDWTMEDW